MRSARRRSRRRIQRDIPRVFRAARRIPAPEGLRGAPEYTERMALVEAQEHYADELIAEVERYNATVDRELLLRAFRYSAAAHAGQQRRSGEAFILHPLGVARICAELQLDEQTIASALLHDVVEDTAAESDELRAEFGDEIAQLVQGVT